MSTLNKICTAIGAAGFVGYVGWQLITSNIIPTKSELEALGDKLRAERSEFFVSKSELNPVVERMENKLDKMNDQLTEIKIELAGLRKETKQDSQVAYGGK